MNFRGRTILGIVAVQAIAGVILTVSALALVDDAGRSELAHRADSGVRLAATLLREAIIAGDWKAAEHLAGELMESGNFASLEVVGSGGQSIVKTRAVAAPDEDGWVSRREAITNDSAELAEVAIVLDDEWQDRILANAQTSLGIISLLAVAFAGLVATGLGTYLTEQLAAIRHAADTIASGHFDVQVEAGGPGEFRAVGEAMNMMSTRIGALYADLERTLADRTHALNSTFVHMSQGVAIYGADARLVAANAAFAALYGFPGEQVWPGLSLDGLVDAYCARGLLDADFAARLRSLQWEGPGFAFELPMADGRIISVHRTRLPDGGFISIHEDVTRQREDQRRLQHAAKLATLGELATATAHELNQPLNVIRLSADNVRARLARGVATSEYLADKLERIAAQTVRAAAIVDHMRIFGRKPAETAAPFDLSGPLHAASEFFAETARMRGYKLDVSAEPGLVVLGHPVLIEQVVANILSNAVAALAHRPESAKPMIRLRAFRQGNSARVEIGDNAGGVPADVLSRIFEPFFTTKPAGEGTGLGLSISYGIISDMGGWLEARNQDDGAVFSFDLPLCEMPAGVGAAERKGPAGPVAERLEAAQR